MLHTFVFFVNEIGSIVEDTWVASIKKPNGQLIYRVLSSYGTEDGEGYVVLSISDLYVDNVGQCKIAINGYHGANIVEEDDEIVINGTPNIIATGEVAIMVNYTPQALPRMNLNPTDLEQIMGVLSQKLDTELGIVTITDDSDIQALGVANGQKLAKIIGGVITFGYNNNGTFAPYSTSGEDETTLRNKLEKSFTFIKSFPTTNANGYELSDYSATFTQDHWNIKYNGNECTEEQARAWVSAITGSSKLPTFDEENPQFEFVLFKAEEDYGDLVKNGDYVFGKVEWDTTNKLSVQFVTKLSVDIDLSEYAKVDGNYPQMQVGLTNQVKTNLTLLDKAPYVFRTTAGGSDIANEYKSRMLKVVGCTICVNQVVDTSSFNTQTISGVAFTKNQDGSITVNGTNTSGSDAYANFSINSSYRLVNHSYLIKGCASGGSSDTYFIGDGYGHNDIGSGYLFTPTNAAFLAQVRIYVKAGVTVTNKTFRPQLIDLTRLFGVSSLISNDFSTLDFDRLFPNYPSTFNSGELVKSFIMGKRTIGYNAYNKNGGGLIRVVSGETYVVEGSSVDIEMLDINQETLTASTTYNSGSEIVVSNKTCYFSVSNVVDTNALCIHLKHSGSKSGYEPYETNHYGITFNGNGIFGVGGDEKSSNGAITRKYVSLDLGLVSGNYDISGITMVKLNYLLPKMII